jgi:two-component system, NarL family, sensor kinase
MFVSKRYIAIPLLLLLFNPLSIARVNVKPDTSTVMAFLERAKQCLAQNSDSASYFSNEALKISNQLSFNKFISLSNESFANYYMMKEDYGNATHYMLEALKIEESRKDELRIADLNRSLGDIYSIMERFSKSMNYYLNALHIYENKKDSLRIAVALERIGALHFSREFCETRDSLQKREDYSIALKYWIKSAALYKSINENKSLFHMYVGIGLAYGKLLKRTEALHYLYIALDYFKETNDLSLVADVYYALGITFNRLKDYQESIECYNKTIELYKQLNMTNGIQYLYESIAYSCRLSGDYKNAYDYYMKYMILRDSIYNSEKSQQVFELETRYQTEKKEKEILALAVEKKKRGLYIFILLSAFIILSLGSLFLIRYLTSRRIIAEQSNRIKEQEIEQLKRHQQLIATQSVLAGEEIERQRLARDLHDGLGGLLSGLKFNLNDIKGDNVLSDESVKQFDRTLGLLDNSIRELRRVAHNLMPEALIKLGLKDALGDFCSGFDNADAQIRYRCYGEHKRIDQGLEIVVYRIVQELVNNALKHSGASEVIVQILQDEKRLSLTVQDNGKGFDLSNLDINKSIGLSSIKSRVSAHNGSIDINTEPGKGTEIQVEFSI